MFNFFCSGVGIAFAWSTTARSRVSDGTAVTFSVKCFSPLKLYPASGNIIQKAVTGSFIHFIYSRAFNKYWFPTVNLIAVTAVLLMSWLYRCLPKIFNEQINYFQILDALFRQLYCLKFSLKSVHTSKSYARKQKWVLFFWTHCIFIAVCELSHYWVSTVDMT